jgi:hypothetical protein
MTNIEKNTDLVYLWVDGSDTEWLKKKLKYTGNTYDKSEANCKGRYVNNDELKYSLRSVSKHLPWIRKIFIVTDGQCPLWLDNNNQKIQLIDHKDIMPNDCLPCFNASAIEFFIHKIPDLSEFFIVANDDTFVNCDLNHEYFFSKEGLPVVRLKRKLFGRWHFYLKKIIGKKNGVYAQMIKDASDLIRKKTGKSITGVPHHNLDSYRKSFYSLAVESYIVNEIENTKKHPIRQYGDLNRAAVAFYAIGVNQAETLYVNRYQSSRLLPYRHNFQKYMKHYNPELFCVNDNQHVSDEQRLKIKPFLESYFPNKSEFEI